MKGVNCAITCTMSAYLFLSLYEFRLLCVNSIIVSLSLSLSLWQKLFGLFMLLMLASSQGNYKMEEDRCMANQSAETLKLSKIIDAQLQVPVP